MVIKQEFIPKAEALSLKLLGFDEECFGYYLDDSDTLRINHVLHTRTNTDLGTFSDLKSKSTAALYQQAFRWFREVYNIQGYVQSNTVAGTKAGGKVFTNYFYTVNGINGFFFKSRVTDEVYPKHEDAELACLRKLIEIVKQQQ